MPLVTSSCNQCEQNNHNGCPAEKLASSGFVEVAGDHCSCAYNGHKSEQTTKEIPKIKSMLGRQKEERDVPVDKKISVEEEVELERD